MPAHPLHQPDSPASPPACQPSLNVFVDGACRGNPGPGGWGVYIHYADGQEKHLCGGEADTTNNRMELTAALQALKATTDCQQVTIWTDSNYVKQGMTTWLAGWKNKNWRKSDGKPVLNADLWQQLDQSSQHRHIEWRWIKGHAGHPGNELADQLANRGADQIIGQAAGTPGNNASPDPNDWLVTDPLGLDMLDSHTGTDDPADYPGVAQSSPEADWADWIDPVDPKTPQEQQHKTQQLEDQQQAQSNAAHGIQMTYADPAIAEQLALNPGQRQLILDTETTGFNFSEGDRIIEIGVLEMVNRKLTGSSLHVYLNPQRPVGDSVNVHGLSDDFLQDKPYFAHIAQPLFDYLQGAEIIAHNATFDMNFLEGEFVKAGFASLKNQVQVTDTLAIAKRKHPGQKNSLDALVKRYDIPPRDRTFHGALLDAEILADVYLAMTGGQVRLEIGQEHEQAGSLSGHRLFGQRLQLPVIKASEQELSLHQQWLDQFAARHGFAALWQQTLAD